MAINTFNQWAVYPEGDAENLTGHIVGNGLLVESDGGKHLAVTPLLLDGCDFNSGRIWYSTATCDGGSVEVL